tara:strand:- start:402 stop:665 length:264 start_codon:yes stop_codon:yes gene_type:complete
MDFSFYPIQDSDFYKTKIDVMKATDNCLNSLEYKENGGISNIYGYHKPLKENCKPINIDHLKDGPENTSTGSIWNNMTRRKTLVKDY